jgi:hypothetical protein
LLLLLLLLLRRGPRTGQPRMGVGMADGGARGAGRATAGDAQHERRHTQRHRAAIGHVGRRQILSAEDAMVQHRTLPRRDAAILTDAGRPPWMVLAAARVTLHAVASARSQQREGALCEISRPYGDVGVEDGDAVVITKRKLPAGWAYN